MQSQRREVFNIPSFFDVKSNLSSGITVGLVNIPLSLALGIACGATPLQGIITAIWAGILSSMLGGSKFNILGPTGALSGILMGFAVLNGAETLPFMAIAVGLSILLCYFFKWYKYIIFIPVSAIQGFTLGVALLLVLSQFDFLFGTVFIENSDKLAKISAAFTTNADISVPSMLLFLFSLIFLLSAKKVMPKIPAAILISAIGILVAYLSEIGVISFKVLSLNNLYSDFEGNVFQNIMPNFSGVSFNKEFFSATAAVSVVAILETLISARIATEMTGIRFNRKKEIIGLSMANIFSGIMGGIPATAALARTALNIKSGATHYVSAFISSICVILVSLFLFDYFRFMPLAVIAAILTNVAVNMVEFEHIKGMFKLDKVSFILLFVVAILTVIEDPIVGILVGSIISLLRFVSTISKSHAEITVVSYVEDKPSYRTSITDYIEGSQEGDIICYRFAGEMTYITAPVHLDHISKIKGNKIVVLSFRNLYFMDIEGLQNLGEMICTLESNGHKVALASISDNLKPSFDNNVDFKRLETMGLLFASSTKAVHFYKGNNLIEEATKLDQPITKE
jgi:SulP family sulfate permease